MKLYVHIAAFFGALIGSVGLIWLNVGEIPPWMRIAAPVGYIVSIACQLYIIRIRRKQIHE